MINVGNNKKGNIFHDEIFYFLTFKLYLTAIVLLSLKDLKCRKLRWVLLWIPDDRESPVLTTHAFVLAT